MTALRFTRQPDAATGTWSYLVLQAGAPGTPEAILGTVTNRRGDWWRATDDRGHGGGSFHTTRRAAAAALVRNAQVNSGDGAVG